MGIEAAFHATGNLVLAFLSFVIAALYFYWTAQLIKPARRDPNWILVASVGAFFVFVALITSVIGVSRLMTVGPVMVLEHVAIASVLFWAILRAGLIFTAYGFIVNFVAGQYEGEYRHKVLIGCGWGAVVIFFVWAILIVAVQ